MPIPPGRPQPGDPATPPRVQPEPWSPAQLARLENEWRKLQRAYAYHPTVRIISLVGTPPGEYQIDYKLHTLAADAAGELTYLDQCSVHIWLPPQFPHATPVVRPMFPLFHPNATLEWIHLDPPWNPSTGTLVEIVRRCGELIAFQIYDPETVHNPTAMEWVRHYPHLLPTDPHADLAPEAGGDSLSRIVRHGTQTLEQHRDQLTEMSLAILEGRPNTAPDDVRKFAEQTSLSVSLFSAPDVPDPLRALAADLDEWVRSMMPGHSLWDDLRLLYRHTRAAAAAGQQTDGARAAVEKAVRVSESLVVGAEPSPVDPTETLARVPPVAVLDPIVLGLRRAVRDAEQGVALLRTVIESLSLPPLEPIGTPGGMLNERTTVDVTRGQADAATARQACVAARAAIEPVLERAKLELRALENVVAWAGFTDLIRRGNELKQRLQDLGVAGIQAFTVRTPSGERGPYQFEERVDLGAVTLVARRIGAAPVHVFEARSTGLLGKGTGGVRVNVPSPDGKTHEYVIRPTEHTDELRVLLNYLITTSRELMRTLGRSDGATAAGNTARAGGGASASWAARFGAALAGPAALSTAADVHRRTTHRWMALLADLIDVGHLKERLATYHLFERHAVFIPAVLALRDKARASVDEANERLAYIAARCTRDVETDHLIVPPHLGRENLERLKQRDKGEHDLRRVRKLLNTVAAELERRIALPRLHGRPGVPRLRFLHPMPDSISAMAGVLTNAHLAARAAEIDRLVGTKFASRAPDPSADPPPAPPEPRVHVVPEGPGHPEPVDAARGPAHPAAGAVPAAHFPAAPAFSDAAADAADTPGGGTTAADEAQYAADAAYVAEQGSPDDPYTADAAEPVEGFVIDPSVVPETDDSRFGLSRPGPEKR